MLNNTAGLNHLATYLHSPETGNQSPSTKHPENILQALKNFTNFFFFKHSTTWAPKASAKELQQEAPFLLFCKDWAMKGVLNCHGTTGFLCQQHMPPPPYPPETTSTPKRKPQSREVLFIWFYDIKIHLEKGICLDDIKWKTAPYSQKTKTGFNGWLKCVWKGGRGNKEWQQKLTLHFNRDHLSSYKAWRAATMTNVKINIAPWTIRLLPVITQISW